MALGSVKLFLDDEGWGVLTSEEVPGEIWVHFSSIEGDGYRSLQVGQRVDFDWEPARQDGYLFRATRAKPL
jgi:CspA family cold shock protein